MFPPPTVPTRVLLEDSNIITIIDIIIIILLFSRRRSRRTRFRNLRYESPETEQRNTPNEEHATPDVENAAKEDDDDFLLQVPSSSTSTKRLQPRIMLKKRRFPLVVDTLAKILKEIGVYEELYEFMKSRGITAEAVKYMKLRHIDELFRGTRLSTKIIFEHKLREWQNKFGICEVSTTQSANFKTNFPSTETQKIDDVHSTRNNNLQKNPFEASLNNMFEKNDTTAFSSRLMEVIKQSVNTVLEEFKTTCSKQSPGKHTDCEMEYNNESFSQDNKNDAVKLESFPFVNLDEAYAAEPKQKTIANKETSTVVVSDEASAPEKIQKKVVKKDNIKDAKPSIQIKGINNSVTPTSLPSNTRKRKYNPPPTHELDVSVEEILNKFPFGQKLKEEYHMTGILTPQQRTELVRNVVEFYIETYEVLNVRHCHDISEQIVELFPNECLETYFLQENKKQPPKGKVWDRYQGRKRTKTLLQRKSINFNGTQQQQNTPNTQSTKNTPNTPKQQQQPQQPEVEVDASNPNGDGSEQSEVDLEKTDWSDMKAMCSKMKTMKDEKDLLTKWKESFNFRRYQLKSEWFSNWKLYFDEYPFVKQQNYGQYIESDLNTLYPNLKFNEFLWLEFLRNFKTFFLNRVKHPKSKFLFDQLFVAENLDTTSDYVAIKVIELLHAVLKTHGHVLSIEDAQRQFTIEVPDLPDLKRTVIERKKQCTDNKLQAKPYIAVVGQQRTYTHFSVILDSTGFSCDNYKEALVLCFNLYLFFDLSFPTENVGVWLFIQKYFFNKSSNITNPRVETFINDIKAQKQITLDIKHGIFEK